ncbi:MAG: serine hydrolase [bacterium]|nr:serine hydrolase [bacterium]
MSELRSRHFLVSLTLAVAIPAQDTQSNAELAATVERFCQPLVDAEAVNGLAVFVLDGDREYVGGFGRLAPGAEAAPDGRTIYEIGSISKVFTGLLLADSVERGVVALADPVQKHLPADVELKERGGEPIRLWHLATHTSGLPRMPRDEAKDPDQPFAHYDVEGIHAAIRDARARRQPGTIYEYSNLGAGILGYALMRANGCEAFDELLQQRITIPLGMADTVIALDADQSARFAPPHDANGDPDHAWDLAMMAGAGGIRSTVADLLKFARLQIAPGDHPLAAAVRRSQQQRHEGQAGVAMALGWHIARDGATLVHSGQTGGYHAYLLISPKDRRAVGILTNIAAGDIDVAGERLLQKLFGMKVEPHAPERPATVERDALKRLVGRYRLLPGMEMEVTLRDRGLYAKITNQPAWRLYARSETEFFYRVVEASVTFEGAEGKVDKVVLHQNGRDIPYKRVE